MLRTLSNLMFSACYAPNGEGGPGGGRSALERAGDIKLTGGEKAGEFAEAINTAARAVQEVANDSSRANERAAAAEARLNGLLREAKTSAKAEWDPRGDVRDLEAKYLLPDGTVRLGRSYEDVNLPDGSIERTTYEGLLTDPYPVTIEQERARRAYAGFAIAYARAKRGQLWRDGLLRSAYVAFRKAMMALPGRVGEWTTRVFTDPELFRRVSGVVDKTSTQGGELLIVPQLQDIRRPMDLARRIPGLFNQRRAPARSFKPLSITGRSLSRTRGATQVDPARFPVQRFTTAETTLTVVDRVNQALIDPLWAADSAKILDDPMGFVMSWLDSGDIDTLELAILHADTNAQDTKSTWTMGGYYTAGDLDGSDSPLTWWIGLRARAADDGKTASAGGTWDSADTTGIEAMLKNHRSNAVHILGIHCLLTQFMGNSNFLTWDKVGPNASLLTGIPGGVAPVGTAGTLFGKAMILSEFLSNEYTTAAGLYTGSNTANVMVTVDPTAWDLWDYPDGAEDYDVVYPDRAAQYVGIIRRAVFASNTVTGEYPVAMLYNL